MRVVKAELESESPYSQSKGYEVPKLDRETHDEFEKRTWRNRMHVDKDGYLYMPAMSFKGSLDKAVSYTPMKGPTGKQSTWAKNFLSGVMILENVKLPIKAADVQGERLHVPSDGKKGGSKRVWKYFPTIQSWKGTVEFLILDDSISESVFKKYLEDAGTFIGVGRWRPQNGGLYGRFKVVSLKWAERL